jgi:crossover junction endodeoxyribonuclease RusA
VIIHVHGLPAPQGSKRHVGHGVMIESSAKVKPWREAVKWAALTQLAIAGCETPPLTGPIRVVAIFKFPRPKSHYRTGRNAHLLRDDAPEFKMSRPDGEKLERSTYDALTDAGVWRDDAQVVDAHWTKVYSDSPGAHLVIEAL